MKASLIVATLTMLVDIETFFLEGAGKRFGDRAVGAAIGDEDVRHESPRSGPPAGVPEGI